MPDYYRLDPRKLTLREYWNIARSWKAIIPWLAARFGAGAQFGASFPYPKSVRELEIPEGDFSPQAKAKLQPLVEQCLQQGFHMPRFYTHATIRGDVRTSFISMLHASGDFTLRLMHSLGAKTTSPIENVLAVLLSELNDCTFFFTSDQREKFKTPPGILNNRLIGAPPLKLIESHRQKLAALSATNPPRRVQSTEALDALWDRYEKVSFDFQCGRGVYVPMTSDEVQKQQPTTPPPIPASPEAAQYGDILNELQQLQNKKSGWGTAIVILAVSLFLFVGTGARQWSWEMVLLLVPILFVHELGHYVMMRGFNYKNLRMFFIPFFGAAVSGRHYNVAGWKKVIVSMMGPAPGIILGSIIGGLGLVLHEPWLIKVALFALILNGLNLLPILPLDGGWVFHTLLFSRHPMLDAGFRLVAALALMAGGMFSNDKILMYLSIPMLISIPAAYRTSRITETLRERGVPPVSPDDQTIPPETAVAIITELKKTLPPKIQANKLIAQRTLQIFETLNSRPPGWAATLGLLFAWGATVGLAVMFTLVIIVGQVGDFSRFWSAVTRGAGGQPITCGAHSSWRGEARVVASHNLPITIVAGFRTSSDAAQTFRELTNRLPSVASLAAFGNSLLLTLPAGDLALRKQWLAELEHKAKTAFVDGTNSSATFKLSCQFATETHVKEVEEELTEYFSNGEAPGLIPPWLPDDTRTPEQRAAHRLARKSYVKALTSKSSGHDTPELLRLRKQLEKAQRQADETEATALSKKFYELIDATNRERLERLKTGKEGPVDPAVITSFLSLSGEAATNQEARELIINDLAKRMGQLPAIASAPKREGKPAFDDRFSANLGMVSSKSRRLRLDFLNFVQMKDGAPALLDWLCSKGASDFRYSVDAGPTIDFLEDR